MTSNEIAPMVGGLVFVLFGIFHVSMFIYLRSHHPKSQYYNKLKVSLLMVVLLVSIGMIAFVNVVSTSRNESPVLLVYLRAIVFGIAFPLGILGAGWFWGIGKSLLSKPVKDLKHEITRS